MTAPTKPPRRSSSTTPPSSTLEDPSITRVRAALRHSTAAKFSVFPAQDEIDRMVDSPERDELAKLLAEARAALEYFDTKARGLLWRWGAEA